MRNRLSRLGVSGKLPDWLEGRPSSGGRSHRRGLSTSFRLITSLPFIEASSKQSKTAQYLLTEGVGLELTSVAV